MEPQKNASLQSPLILVADDDQYSRDMLGRMLQSEGYRVVLAEDGYQALAMFAETQPDAVLLDIQMPGINGFEVCQRLRDEHSNSAPVIMITALDDQRTIEQAFVSGASEYITKPITWSILRHRLRRLLLTTHVMRELEVERSRLNEERAHLEHVVEDRTAELVAANKALQQEIAARREAEDRQSKLISGLRVVIAAVDELMLVRDTDALCLRAIEIARERMGVERCAIYLEEGDSLRGTYGTDIHGNIVGEQYARVPAENSLPERFRVISPSEQQWIVQNANQTEWVDNEMRLVGEGWIALSRLRSTRRNLGVFFNDAAISGSPVDPIQQEIISVYSSMLGAVLEHKSIEEAMRHKSAYLSALHEATLTLAQRLDLEAALETIIQQAGDLVGTSDGYLAVYDPTSQDLVVRVGLGSLEQGTGGRIAVGEGLAGKVWQSGKILAVDDYSEWPARSLNRHVAGMHAMVGIPLYSGPEIMGVLGLSYSEVGRHFGAAEIEILTRFGELASIALHNSRLYADLQYELTERKRIEESLRRSEERFRKLIESAPSVIIAIDTDGRIVLVNKRVEALFGYASEDLIGKPIEVLLPERFKNIHIHNRQNYIDAPTIQSMSSGHELSGRHRDGTEFAVEVGLGFTQTDVGTLALAFVTDITERNRAREALAHERDLLRSLMDNIPDTIYFKDTDSRFTRINSAQARLLGLSDPDQAIGKMDSDFQPGEMASLFHAEEQHLLTTGQPILDRLEFNPTPDGRERWFSATKVAIRDRQDRIIGLVAVSRNVTEFKRLEARLRQTLEKQNELSELKSRFITMASHEFRTPLTIISSSTGLLKLAGERYDIDQRNRQFSKIDLAVHQIVQLLDDVLTFGQAEDGALPFNPEPIDLDNFCLEIVEQMQSTTLHAPTISFLSSKLCQPIWLDKKLLRQIMTNLLSNALKYSPPDSQIDVVLACVDQFAEIVVADQGIGIPEKDLAHLFEPFHRAGNVGTIQGTGLGLAILKKAVAMHGGTINVKSEANAGTTFIVRLPLVQETVL